VGLYREWEPLQEPLAQKSGVQPPATPCGPPSRLDHGVQKTPRESARPTDEISRAQPCENQGSAIRYFLNCLGVLCIPRTVFRRSVWSLGSQQRQRALKGIFGK